MGSGLILLVIVAAWLAVLVPMALRSHESSTSLSSVDRFSDAMRVLSRRDAAARARARREAEDDPLSAQAWAANDADDAWDEPWDDAWDDELAGPSWSERLVGWRDALTGRVPALGAAARRGPSTPVTRRRRLLLGLVWATLATTFLGVVGPRALLAVAGVLGVALVLFVVQLRRLAVARASRGSSPARPAARPVAARQAAARRAAEAPLRASAVRVEPVDVPAEPLAPTAEAQLFDQAVFEPVASSTASPAVRHDEPVPAAEPAEPPAAAWVPAPAAALGEAWSPVPVPPPTYVTAAVAPPPARRVVDLTRPGAWSQHESARPAEELPGTAPATPPAADRRRAVNEW